MIENGIMHVHSMFSLYDSTQTPEEIVKWCYEHGCRNITLTDHGSLLGVDDFMEAGEKYGINTIPGVEAYLENRVHLVLLPVNADGFRAISEVIRDANENQIKKGNLTYPIITEDVLKKLTGNENIIASSACISGPICSILLQNFYTEQKRNAIIKKAESFKEDALRWSELYQKYKTIAEEEKALKKERTIYRKYITDAYQEQLEKDKAKFEKNPQLLSLKERISLKENNIKLANEYLPKMEKQIAEKAVERAALKRKADALKSKKDQYKELQESVKKYKLISEKELLKLAEKRIMELKHIFPKFYIELQYHGLPQEDYVMPMLVKLATKTKTPLIAANDAHMTCKTDDCLQARQIIRFNYFEKHQELSEADRELYLKEDEELLEALCKCVPQKAAEEALKNLAILNECHVVFKKEPHYPKSKSNETFDDLIYKAREKKIQAGEWSKEHEEQLKREMQIIPQMGYVDYHLVVRDYCNMIRKLGCIPRSELKNMPLDFNKVDEWIQKKGFRTGIGVGPGRGSAAGSLVCYLLGITNIDPIKYGLLFDRYLNPERVTLPDIDTDVKTSIRNTAIRCIKFVYGERAVCSIMTKTTYAAKGSIKMVGRDRAGELFPFDKEKRKEYLHKYSIPLADMIPEEPNMTLKKAEKNLINKIEENPEFLILWNRAKLIEGRLFATGIHAGGIVISDNDDINEYVPLAYSEDKENGRMVWAAQCDMVQLEKKGMLKMDLLGLNTLDVISDTVQLIEKHKGIVIDIDKIPFEDVVFQEIFAKGETNSVFQYESQGMKSMLKEFQPTCFEDLIILVAAYRPGPMQFLPDLIARKHGRKPMKYRIKALEPILSGTYAAIIYQEQVMKIFQVLAGYSLGQADLVRRAMSKKKEEELKIERQAFVYGDESRGIHGCINNNIPEEEAHHLFDEVLDFARYAFNKSHAACYAMLSYITAWLKYHYPLEFQCSMLNNKDIAKYGPILEDLRKASIHLLPPSIQSSQYEFSIEGNSIRYGFKGIKGIGTEESTYEIIRSRNNYGPYQSFMDFIIRNTNKHSCSIPNKKLMEALINTGCFDSVLKNREELLQLYLELSERKIKSIDMLQLFKNDLETRLILPEKNSEYNRKMETELLGTVVSEDPFKEYRDESYYGCDPIGNIPDGNVTIMGYVSSMEKGISNAGNEFMTLGIVGKTTMRKVLFMERNYAHVKNIEIYRNRVVRIKGTAKDGTIFGRNISFLQPTDSGYSIILDSQEVTDKVTEIMKERENGAIRLVIMFFYGKNGRLDHPVVREYRTTYETIQKLHAKKLIKIAQKEKK